MYCFNIVNHCKEWINLFVHIYFFLSSPFLSLLGFSASFFLSSPLLSRLGFTWCAISFFLSSFSFIPQNCLSLLNIVDSWSLFCCNWIPTSCCSYLLSDWKVLRDSELSLGLSLIISQCFCSYDKIRFTVQCYHILTRLISNFYNT